MSTNDTITVTQWLTAVVVFAAGSAALLLVIGAARAAWQRGRDYITVQDVDAGMAFGGDYEE